MHIQPHSQTLNYSGGGILMHIQPHSQALNYRGEKRPPLSFLKIEKSVLILERKALIVSIFGLNYQFKM